MGDEPGGISTYRTVLKTVGVDLDTILVGSGGSIARPDAGSGHITVDSLPRLAVAAVEDPPKQSHDLRLIDKLGEGGMGLVWVATQVTLDRKVAVKQLRDHRRGDVHEMQLLREALVTGALEHPNIVPIHSIGRTDEGGPLIVMKYIEGEPWRDAFPRLFDDDGEVDPDVTDQQLGIFLQICNAMSFAHARGILHRDLKPDNIMIGSFGEVYVVDWGLAVSLRPGGKVPAATERRGLEGTPGYMAPEMAACKAEDIDERTDVYLLGAILHELVVGARRHVGENMVEILAAAYHSRPYDYGPRVPSELADLCNRACARERDDRFPDARSLRDAVADFLRHRSSRRMADGAHERLAVLERFIVADRDRSVEDAGLHGSATEARFGFSQALAEWPDNPEAGQGLQRTLELMIEYELRHRNPRAAAALLPELPEPRPDLAGRVAELEREVREDKQRMRELERKAYESDIEVAARARRRVSLALGIVLAVTIGGLFVSRMAGLHRAGYPDALAVTAVFTIAVAWGTRYLARVGGNLANRRVMAGIGVCCGGLFALFGISAFAEVDFSVSLALAMVVSATACGCLAAMLDWRFLRAAVAFLLTAIGVALWPEYRGAVLAVGCLTAFSIANVRFDDTDD